MNVKMQAGKGINRLKYVLFGLLLLMLLLPAFQRELQLFKEKPLTGAFVEMEKPTFRTVSWNDWFSGAFQADFDSRLEHSIGFRNSLIRTNNQLQYSLFGLANADGVIAGSRGELFEEDYIRAYMGAFFVGESVWEQKAHKLKAIQDSLQKLGKSMSVVFAPGKGSYYPEKFPAKYRNKERKLSNYNYFRQQLNNKGVHVLDLNAFFLHQKAESRHPLFAQTGTHWSYYGAALAADTTLAYLRWLHGPHIPEMKIQTLKENRPIRHPDDDIWLAMNLLFDPPQNGLVYPTLQFEKMEQQKKYKLMTVGDSFYFNWLSDSIMYYGFDRADFWYYNRFIWDKNGAQTGLTADIDYLPSVMEYDIVLIMITERFHHNFAWLFDHQLYDALFPGKSSRIDYFANNLRVSNDQFMRLEAEARQKGMPIEERIKREAEFLMYEDYQKNPELYTTREDRIQVLMMSMRGTPAWFAAIVEKAEKAGISIDEALRKDAEWIIDNP
jgi:hypothetical protein